MIQVKLMKETEVESKMVQIWCGQGTILSGANQGHNFCPCVYTGKVYKTRLKLGSDKEGKESSKGSNGCWEQVTRDPMIISKGQ